MRIAFGIQKGAIQIGKNNDHHNSSDPMISSTASFFTIFIILLIAWEKGSGEGMKSFYFPTQKFENILFRTSSFVVSPAISPR